MLVTRLINLVSSFVFGRGNPNEDDRVEYLNYLNLADQELFRSVKNSKRLQKEIDLFFPVPDLAIPATLVNYLPLPENYISGVYGHNQLEYVDKYFNNLNTFEGYYFLNNNIYINKKTY